MPIADVVVVGGGIVGLATALALQTRFPRATLTLLEKEHALAAHQTSRNSGVIHSGIYYRPGSLKAQTCVAGAKLMVAFCQARQIPYRICGKLIVATAAAELPALKTLYQRGLANGVPGLAMVGPERIQELEPHARGIKAIHVPGAGLVDYGEVARAMAQLVQERGGAIRTWARVTGLRRQQGAWLLRTTVGEVRAAYLVACGGLYSDRLAVMAGAARDVRIIPFRGDYYNLVPAREHLVTAMIYPVPNPAFPFLGVHFTRSIHGGVHAGPNAVLAWKREGYRMGDLDLRDAYDILSFSGFWTMARKHWRMGMEEAWRALSKPAFVRALQRLVPEIRAQDLVPGGSGVRAQAVDAQGVLLDDFNIVQEPGAIHVRNVPSPAATASLKIGQLIAEMAAAPQLDRLRGP